MSLKALFEKRVSLASELQDGIDPIERKATEKLKLEADAAEAHGQQLDRLEVLAEKQARLTVRGLFALWHGLALKQRCDAGAEAKRAFERDVFPLIGDVAVADVTKAHIQEIVDTMMGRDVERVVYDFVTEYLDTNRVATPNYKRAIDAFGEQGVVDLVGVCGYYMLVSMTLNVFEMPLPPGEPEPLV